MYKTTALLTLLMLLLISSCAPVVNTAVPTSAPTSVSTQQPSIPVTGVAVVQSMEIQILEGQPLQVNAMLRGQLPDAGCTTISSVDQRREGNVFQLALNITTDPLAICAQALTPFEKVVPLDVSNLVPAEYSVRANGAETSFELLTRDVPKFKQLLLDALNTRNYELLRLMMNESLAIAIWQSEGTIYEAAPAIEQLQTNHLNNPSPITADVNKDLSTLPAGVDPLTLFKLDVGPNFGLFVSGWGPEGKDEAVLYVNYLLDGSLYWHGMIVARGGFKEPETVVMEPVDVNAYPTSVEYIMAQQDVNIRSGPGTQFRIIGYVVEGQTAKVTGVSVNGNWWRVICPDDSVGNCWVSADRSLTRPTDPIGKADVQSVDIQLLESFPVQVNAIARGQLPDAGCTTIAGASQSRTGNVFTVVLTTRVDPNALCSQVITLFEYVIPLDVSSLLPAFYIVNVNGVEATFELPDMQPPQ
jgi:hypothetical protein